MFHVGDEVVLMVPLDDESGSPVFHDSRQPHPCRGRVTKMGRKWMRVGPTRGADWRVPIEPEWMRVSAFHVDDAKARYRKLLERDEQRTDTDALVEAL